MRAELRNFKYGGLGGFKLGKSKKWVIIIVKSKEKISFFTCEGNNLKL